MWLARKITKWAFSGISITGVLGAVWWMATLNATVGMHATGICEVKQDIDELKCVAIQTQSDVGWIKRYIEWNETKVATND